MDEQAKRALVTGGAGFIGSHLVDLLLSRGWNVTVVDDLSGCGGGFDNVKHHLEVGGHPNLRLIQADFASPLMLTKVRAGEFDVVFHFAAKPRVSYSVEHPAETNDINVGQTVRLLEACKGNIKRFIFSSSSSVYGGAELMPTPPSYKTDPKSPYALQKLIVEDYLRMFGKLYGFDSVCLRYFNVFGPRARGDGPYATAVSAWIHCIKNNLPLRSDGDGSQSRDMCYVSNVVQANYLAAISSKTFAGEAFNVACGDRTTNLEVLEYLMKRYSGLTVNHAPWRPGDVMHTQASVQETVDALGYSPDVTFWKGLEMTLEAEGL